MFHGMKLGRISRPIPAGVPTLRDHAIARIAAPPVLLRDHIDFRPGLDGNDVYGDCTCVAVANAVRAQAALGGFEVPIVEADTIGLYCEACGYVPGNPATDCGGIEVDVLAYQASRGFDTAAGQVPFVGLWATLDPKDMNLLRLVMARMGVGYLGVRLAMADQQPGVDGVWDTDTPAAAGDPTPGSWGGHALCIWSYTGVSDTDTVELVTWGRLQRATWRWVHSRMEEAHALFHRQLGRADRTNFIGIDMDRLSADVESYAANA